MKICIVGAGYVGLVAAAGFAETGNDVYSYDIDKSKIDKLRRGILPIYEPGLAELISRNKRGGRLRFSTDIDECVTKTLIIFIAVGTPAKEDGSSDVKHVLSAVQSIARAMNGYKIIVLKSTVPVGTADQVRRVVSENTRHEFDVVNNPEFLKEGAALEDFMKPNRVVIGADDVRAAEIMRELYSPFLRTGAPFLVMDNRSAELTKYAANAMLATRISFMNEMANLCQRVKADIHLVRQGIGTDHRIGPSFLFSGLGYGGSCFPKDIEALIDMGRRQGLAMDMVTAVHRVNERQRAILVDWIVDFFSTYDAEEIKRLAQQQLLRASTGAGRKKSSISIHSVEAGKRRPAGKHCLKGMTFTIWGLSFKPQTDDMREAPSIEIIQRLLKHGAKIRAYDPEAMPVARSIFGNRIRCCASNYEALKGADALVLVTEWNVFRNPDFSRMKKLLRLPVIFDGRNQYNPREMRETGFIYFAVGCP
ncbi:MAG TPA: UDP-glucose/GDP-mannose dehydrogenase family protein [Acidobacteriota bacterium]|jgi:UDPglucose 6-dehydrogenase